MKNFQVEIVPYQRDAKNGRQRDKNLGNVNFLHVYIFHLEIFNPSVLNLLAVAWGHGLAQQARAQVFFCQIRPWP